MESDGYGPTMAYHPALHAGLAFHHFGPLSQQQPLPPLLQPSVRAPRQSSQAPSVWNTLPQSTSTCASAFPSHARLPHFHPVQEHPSLAQLDRLQAHDEDAHLQFEPQPPPQSQPQPQPQLQPFVQPLDQNAITTNWFLQPLELQQLQLHQLQQASSLPVPDKQAIPTDQEYVVHNGHELDAVYGETVCQSPSTVQADEMYGGNSSQLLSSVAPLAVQETSFMIPQDGIYLWPMRNAELNPQQPPKTRASVPVSAAMDNTSDCEWTLVNSTPTSSLGSVDGMVPPPGRNLHFSSSNASDTSDSGGLAGSFDVISPWSSDSPKEGHGEWMGKPCVANHDSPSSSSASSAVMVSPNAATLSSGSNKSFSTSPSSSTPPSPPVRVFGPPVKGLTMRSSIRKSIVPNGQAEKKSVGRRRGPLRPEQRLQAHEIRKMRACLRCRFLKKTCDKNEPCSGCRPSHARLWQVPCTRLDIRDLSYFLKDWTTDYQRHIKLNLSVSNIKGFSPTKWVLQITHGYGHSLAIPAREVFVRDTQGFSVDWIETVNGKPTRFIKRTARLSVGDDGVTAAMIADYLDRHLDQGFEHFVDKHFGGTVFLTEMLKTCYRYYERTGSLVIRKALKLVIAYNLTLHLTLVEAESAKHVSEGKINNPLSKYFGRTAAPVMINFEIKCALAEAWRALQREVLLELSGLYSSVYSGDKLKHWPTIFMIATIVLLVWEEIQFDSHYRRQPGQNVQEFCDEMERTPVGVIVGLFHAISTKVPRFQEWDSEKYHQVLGSNQDVCEVMTEVKGHLEKHNDYLRDRHSASFDAENFECLSNKFLSRLVTRSN